MLDKLVVFVLSLKAKLNSERGQDIMEYALLGGFIAVAAAVAFFLLPLDTYLTNFATTVGNCVNLGANYSCP